MKHYKLFFFLLTMPLLCITELQHTSHLIREYDLLIHYILERSILPDRKINKSELNKLLVLIDHIEQYPNKYPYHKKLIDRIKLVHAQAPRAGEILARGYNIPFYVEQLYELNKTYYYYAQPIVLQQRRDLAAALAILQGQPVPYTIATPSPLDQEYLPLINEYFVLARKLELLGPFPTYKEITLFAEEFKKFDDRLSSTELGQKQRRQIITWLAPNEVYLREIISEKICVAFR